MVSKRPGGESVSRRDGGRRAGRWRGYSWGHRAYPSGDWCVWEKAANVWKRTRLQVSWRWSLVILCLFLVGVTWSTAFHAPLRTSRCCLTWAGIRSLPFQRQHFPAASPPAEGPSRSTAVWGSSHNRRKALLYLCNALSLCKELVCEKESRPVR